MASVKNSDLSAQTITYNGITIGGNVSSDFGTANPYVITAPDYKMSGVYEYDDAGRVIKYTRYTLDVRMIVIGTSAADMSLQIDAIREKLSEPGKPLQLRGLGIGFGSAYGRQVTPMIAGILNFGGTTVGGGEADIAWGPRPLRCDAAPIGGNQAWEILWSIEFRTTDCTAAPGGTPVPLVAFNYSTAWTIDIEGQEQRTISGFLEITINRGAKSGRQPLFTADAMRNSVQVAIPANFVRRQRAFQESADKSRLNFVFVDERLPSDEGYPPGIIAASGNYSVSTQGIGMAQGAAALSLSLTTAPGVKRSRAGLVFWQAVMARQQELSASMRSEGSKVAVFIDQVQMSHELWTRRSQFNATWQLSGCLHDIMFKAGVWTPIPNTNYAQWRASIDHLWKEHPMTL
jgi:hypothetical protein